MRLLRSLTAAAVLAGTLLVAAPGAQATPVCTDGYRGGPPLAACGGRVFPEAANSADYVQFLADPATGFEEYRHGLEYLAQRYPRWVSVFTLRQRYGADAVTAGPDANRPYEPDDTDDGYDILVVKLTDHQVPDAGKQTLLFSLSVHGDEKGGSEGGTRAIEDIAMAATEGGYLRDGVPGYESSTGEDPVFHSYPVRTILAKEAVYFVDFNVDGGSRGDHFSPTPGLYSRGNYIGTDLNRQMPTVGWINTSRNPLTESEMLYGHKLMHDVAAAGVNGQLAYGADVHGEGQSRAWVDIMYPAGQFNSIKHRRLMAIAERTKSVIDDSLYLGVANEIEEATGGDLGEGIEDYGAPKNSIPTKPARWGTVWDTLGYTDTGFIGDYLATELGVTGMDYEIAFNHSDSRAYGRPWSILIQENFINATRSIIKTAMAYAMYQDQDFADFKVDAKGRVGYVLNPVPVTDSDANGPGRLPGPSGNGIGQNGKPVEQKPYSATNMAFFEEESSMVKGGLTPVATGDIAEDPAALDAFDSLVIADTAVPADPEGRAVDPAAYWANIKAWVQRGGNLVLTDRAIHGLGSMGIVPATAVKQFNVYQPYSYFKDFNHPMLKGLRKNARQLAEYTLIGYGIGNTASPMTIVETPAWTAAGGYVVGTTGNNAGTSDNTAQTSVGELTLGLGKIRITNGLGMPTEANDHRYGLKDFALSYSGLYVLENSMIYDAPGLGGGASPQGTPDARDGLTSFMGFLPFAGLAAARRRLRRR